MRLNKLAPITAILFILAVVVAASAETDVFWYKALQNNYALSDSPGPNIPAGAIVHEGKMITCNHSIGLGYNGSGFSCGSGINDDQAWCSFLYSANVNDTVFTGRVDSAFIRGEYVEWNSLSPSSPLNNGGPVNIRCGVVDVSFNVNSVWSGGDSLPDDAVYLDMDFSHTLSYSLPLIDSTIDTLAFMGPHLEQGESLDSQFVRIDVTKQVEWIVQHHNGKYGIALLSTWGQGSTGKFSLWADETCNADFYYFSDPWTKDGNTTHLLVYGDLTDSVHSERPTTTIEQACAVSICPNPFNPSTTISYAIPGNGQAKLAIFSLAGKLVYQKQISGKGSYAWNALGQPSGVYICRVNVAKAGSREISRRMILMR